MGVQSLKLVALIRRYWKLLTVAFLAMLVEGAADLLDPWPLKVIFDYVLGSKHVPSSLAGWLSDRIEPRIVASVGMALVASGTFALTTLADTTPASRGSTESRRASSAPCGCSGRCSA